MAHCAKDVNKAWGGRFSGGMSPDAIEFTASRNFDCNLYAQDIRGSMAHAKMLAAQGILTSEDRDLILQGLREIMEEIEKGEFVWRTELEDVHMNIEQRLIEKIGEAGKRLHTARSRNDQIALSFRIFVADSCEKWLLDLVRLCRCLHDLASENRHAILPGLTHFQPAQPVSLAHHLLAYANMFRRDVERITDALKRIRISPLGACALAGTTHPVAPTLVAGEVGFPKVFANSLDAVSDRDFVLEPLFDACEIMLHLSRLCEELIIWANPSFGFIELPDGYSTGSSIMPQKKNPDVAEVTRGKTGRVYGNLVALLTVMKGLPLAYNKDLQEDKEGFLDTDKTVRDSLEIMAAMLPLISFNAEKMREACSKGFLNATELADYLVKKGIPFREAHHITGKIVAYAERAHKKLEELSLSELKTIEPAIDSDVSDILDYAVCVQRRESPGGTGPNSVNVQLKELAEWLETFPDASQDSKTGW